MFARSFELRNDRNRNMLYTIIGAIIGIVAYIYAKIYNVSFKRGYGVQLEKGSYLLVFLLVSDWDSVVVVLDF